MLLYDHLMLWAANCRKRNNLTAGDYGILSLLKQAVRYEISTVLRIKDDWSVEEKSNIPKRPPHDHTWCEWEKNDERRGHLLVKANHEARDAYIKKSLWPNDLLAEINDAEECYLSFAFTMFLKRNDIPDALPLHQPIFIPGIDVCLLNNNGSTCRILGQVADNADDLHTSNGNSPFSMHMAICIDPERNLASSPSCWPLLAAFSLLHCKNIVAETIVPSDHEQRRAKHAGNPPRTIYKILKIEVPQVKAGHSLRLDKGSDSPGVRFHICSGHFKNLQHDRFKNKGWHWWPAHWRGSRSLGRVEKKYELVPKA